MEIAEIQGRGSRDEEIATDRVKAGEKECVSASALQVILVAVISSVI